MTNTTTNKITGANKKRIHFLLAKGERQQDIAEKYNVSQPLISIIKREAGMAFRPRVRKVRKQSGSLEKYFKVRATYAKALEDHRFLRIVLEDIISEMSKK